MMAPIDLAAAAALSQLLARLERGEVVVTRLAAEDDAHARLEIHWVEASGSEPAASDSDSGAAGLVAAAPAPQCPACGSARLEHTADDTVCRDCAHSW